MVACGDSDSGGRVRSNPYCTSIFAAIDYSLRASKISLDMAFRCRARAIKQDRETWLSYSRPKIPDFSNMGFQHEIQSSIA